MTQIVSAYKARINFGDIINRVYFGGEEIVVTKTGKPLVRIVRVDEKIGATDDVWKRMRRIAKMGRRSFNLAAYVRKDRDRG